MCIPLKQENNICNFLLLWLFAFQIEFTNISTFSMMHISDDVVKFGNVFYNYDQVTLCQTNRMILNHNINTKHLNQIIGLFCLCSIRLQLCSVYISKTLCKRMFTMKIKHYWRSSLHFIHDFFYFIGACITSMASVGFLYEVYL